MGDLNTLIIEAEDANRDDFDATSANTWAANPDARINLTGLAPGNYVVHIKAINSSGVWSNEINKI